MNAVDALREAGYVYVEDYTQPEFDYPLDVWMRESDKVWILGDLRSTPHGYRVLMNPWDTWHERFVSDDGDVTPFVSWFVATFTKLAAQQIDMDQR